LEEFKKKGIDKIAVVYPSHFTRWVPLSLFLLLTSLNKFNLEVWMIIMLWTRGPKVKLSFSFQL
jgi:hypothetical protein